MKRAFLLFSTIIIIITGCSTGKREIKDIIKPVNLIAGRTDSLLISDLFYADHYDPVFLENKNVKVIYNPGSGMVYFSAAEDFSGMTLVDFEFDDRIYSIPVRSGIQQKYRFSYKPLKEYKVLNLFGSFNGWDRGNLPMNDDDGDGIYQTEVPLEPGRYQYKFFGDGEELIDPLNNVKVPNGMGDFNSVFTVEESDTEKVFLHVNGYSESGSNGEFLFVYESAPSGNTLLSENVIALLDNQKLDEDEVDVNGENIKLAIDNGKLRDAQLLRVAVSENGNVSNIQSVFLVEGKPATGNGGFLWNDAIIYSLMIDRFNDGDKSLNNPILHDSLALKANYMGGDFKGIINKLNEGYFDSLGINTIWLSPVYDNPNTAYKEAPAPRRWFSGYHGYWPVSSTATEEKFGTIEQLKELVAIARSKRIKILLDVVANHVHENHPLVKEKPDWFGELKLPDGRLNLRLWDEFRLTTWFEPYLPKFNYVESQQAIDFMASNTIWWMKETGADGFRQDAVKHMPNQFWRELTKRIKKEIEIPENKKVYQIGETFGSYDLISSYVNNGQLTAQFNFNVYDVALPVFLDGNISFRSLDSEIKKSFLVYGENNLMGNIMDSHDKNRFMAFADGDLEVTQWSAIEEGWNNPPEVNNPASYEKAKLYYAYLNTIPGLPVIYYGSEFGMTGASDPDNRRMMRFGNELNNYERKMLEDVRKIINLRKNHPALRYGDFLTVRADVNTYAYIRSDFNERVLIVLNKNPKEQKIALRLPEFYKADLLSDLLNEETIVSERGIYQIQVKGQGYRVLKIGQ